MSKFEIELEFVQCLANPLYVHWLASSGFLRDPCFLHFLHYLDYWRHRDYLKYIVYPHALHNLHLLQTSPAFREDVGRLEVAERLKERQLRVWHATKEGARDGDSESAEQSRESGQA